MFLAYKLLTIELKRNGWWKDFLHYRKSLQKRENHSLRIRFLEDCLKSNIVPKFLKFRIPENGCFDNKAVMEFQLRLLRKELFKAKAELLSADKKLCENRETLKSKISERIIPSIILHVRLETRQFTKTLMEKLNKKLNKLSEDQGKPLFNVSNTVICYELPERPSYKVSAYCLAGRQ